MATRKLKMRPDVRMLPPYSDHDTSRAAAFSMVKDNVSGQQRQAVFDVLWMQRMCCEQLEDRLHLRHSSTSARLWELEYTLKRIQKSQFMHRNRSGRFGRKYEVIGRKYGR